MPDLSEVLNRARTAQRTGQHRQAELLFQQALQTDGANAELWFSHAVACRDQKKWSEATASFQHTIRLNPHSADAYLGLAQVLSEQGKREDAVTNYRHAVRCKPDHSEALTSLGVALAEQGQLDEAIGYFRQAVRCGPESAKAQHNLGIALAQKGKPEESAACLREAIRLKPDYAEAYCNLGNVLKTVGKSEESETNYRKALELRADYADAYINLGLALVESGKPEEAAILLQQAVRLRPESPIAHNNLSLAWIDLGRFAEAETSLQQALRLDPMYAEAHSNLGNLYKAQARMGESVASYEMALRIKPDAPSTHWNRSLAWLLMGDFARGWPEYEWRWKRPQAKVRPFRQPRWDGSSLSGKKILLYMEQGLGDMIQFIRFTRAVKARGGHVIVECPPTLKALFATCPGIDEWVIEGSPLPEFDVQAPMMSLPWLLGTSRQTIPAEVPYVTPAPDRVQAWASELVGTTGFKVGLVWQGNPRFTADRQRSIRLAAFRPLASVEGVTLLSLQKGAGTEQLAEVAKYLPIKDLHSETWPDFMETAAVIANLDLVLTVDTAVAHLAGALGKPVWVTIPYGPDWRWQLEREDSPWYPTMRLFRQPAPGTWSPVLGHIAQELAQLVARTACGPEGPTDVAPELR